jgi:hypothetical protein
MRFTPVYEIIHIQIPYETDQRIQYIINSGHGQICFPQVKTGSAVQKPHENVKGNDQDVCIKQRPEKSLFVQIFFIPAIVIKENNKQYRQGKYVNRNI